MYGQYAFVYTAHEYTLRQMRKSSTAYTLQRTGAAYASGSRWWNAR